MKAPRSNAQGQRTHSVWTNILCRAFHGGCKVFDGIKIGGALTAMVLDQDKVQCRAQHGDSDRGCEDLQCGFSRNITTLGHH